MPNQLVAFYRTQFPKDTRTEDEITLDYARAYPAEVLKQYPDFMDDYSRIQSEYRKLTAPGITTEMKRAVGAGIDQLQAQLYDTAALGGDVLGIPALTKWGQAGYDRNIQEAQAYQPTIQDVNEIGGLGDAVRYGANLAANQVPQLGAIAAAGVIGGVAGGLAGPEGVPVGMEEGAAAMAARLAAAAARAKAIRTGAEIGTGLAGFTQMENRGALLATPGVDKSVVTPTAIGVGAIGAALEELPVIRFLGKMFPEAFGKAAQQVADKYLPRVLQEVPKQALLEGGTEVAQEITTMAGELYANRNNPNYDLTPAEIKSRIINNFVGGAVLGGALGPLEAIHGPEHNNNNENGTEQAGNVTSEAQPEPNPAGAVAPVMESSPAVSPFVSAAPAANPILAQARAAAANIDPHEELLNQVMAHERDRALVRDIIRQERGRIEANTEADNAMLPPSPGDVPVSPDYLPDAGIAARPDLMQAYKAAQARIDAIENKLESEGVDPTKMFDPKKPEASILGDIPGWTTMPQDLVDAHAQRDAIGALQLNESRAELTRRLKAIGITDLEVSRVLDQEYGISPKSEAVDQSIAVHHAAHSAMGNPLKKAQSIALLLASERFDPRTYDQLADIPKETLQDAARIAQVVRNYFLGNDLPTQPQTQTKGETHAISQIQLAESNQPEHQNESYDRAQKRIDSIENKLSADGSDVLRMYDPKSPEAKILSESSGWTAMPKELADAYEERDRIGAGQLHESIAALSSKLAAEGLNQGEVKRVLDYYGMKPGDTDAIAQNRAVEHAPSIVRTNPLKQAEAVAIALAAQRGEFFDETKDIKRGTLIDAAKAVRVVREYFGHNGKETHAINQIQLAESNQPEHQNGNGSGETQGPSSGNRLERGQEVEARPLNTDLVDWDNSALTKVETERGTASKSTTEESSADRVAQDVTRVSEPAFFPVRDLAYSRQLAERLVSDGKGGQGNKSDTRRMTFFEHGQTGEVFGLPTWYTNSKDRGGKLYYVTNPEGGKGIQLSALMDKGYAPVASVRLQNEISGTDQGNVARYADFNDFQQKFLDEANQRMAATARTTSAMEAQMQSRGFDEAGNVIEGGPAASLAEPLNDFRDAIIEELGKTRDLTRDGVREALVNAGKDEGNNAGFMAAIRELLAADQSFQRELASMSPDEAKKALLEKLTDAVYGKVKETNPLATQSIEAGSAGVGAGAELFSRPEQAKTRATTGDIKARFAQALLGAKESGVTVDVVKAVAGTEEFGKWNGKERKITLVLHDAENPSLDNLRLVLHEIAHDVSAALPEGVREAVHLAVNSYTDEKLGITGTTDPRIAQSNPANLAPGVLNEERLAEHLAIAGLTEAPSRGIAAQIVRAVKELYFRTALALQRVFGRVPNPDLAMAYMRNRFEATISADTLFRFLIPPSMNIGRADETYFSQPFVRKTADPKIETHVNISKYNEQIDLEKDIEVALSQVPGVAAAAQAEGLKPMEWLKDNLGLPDAQHLIEAESKKIDSETGLLIGPNANHRIGDFAAEQNRFAASLEAYKWIADQHSNIVKEIGKIQSRIESVEADRESSAKRFQKASEPPLFPLPEAEEAARQARIKKWQKDLQAQQKLKDVLQKRLDAANWVAGLYAKKVNDLAGPNQVHKPFLFTHKAKYLSIGDPATAHDIGNGMKEATILLDSNGQITNREELASQLDKMTQWLDGREVKDGLFYRILAQKEEFLKSQFATDVRRMGHTVTELLVSDAATQAKAQGTALGRMTGQLVNKFSTQWDYVRRHLQGLAPEVERSKAEAASLIGVSEEFYHENFYNRAMDHIENRSDLAEQFPGNRAKQLDAAFASLKKIFTDSDTNPQLAALIRGREEKFLAALRKNVEANAAASAFTVKHRRENNALVSDKSLGKDTVRDFLTRGILTTPRMLSANFQEMFDALKESGWAGAGDTFSNFAKVFSEQGPDAALAGVAPLFSHPQYGKAVERFVRAIATEVSKENPFFAPSMDVKANPAYVEYALKAASAPDGINPVQMFHVLAEAHGGAEDIGGYIQRNLQVLSKYFSEMRAIMEETDPRGMNVKGIATMIPGLMIEGRRIDHWPSSFTTHMSFDSRHVDRIAERLAAQIAFGTDNQKLAKMLNDGAAENQAATRRLEDALAKVKKTVPSTNRKIVEAALAKEVGSAAELARLRRMQKLGKFYANIQGDLIEFFGRRHSVTKSLGFLNVLSNTFATLALNQPGSALSQTAEILTPLIKSGPSAQTIRQVARTASDVVKETTFGLLRSLGLSIQRSDAEFKRALEHGQGDPEQLRTIKEIWAEGASPYSNESTMARGLRKFTKTLTASVGSGNDYVGFRPFGLFNQASATIQLSATVNFVKKVQDMISRGVQWAKENPNEFGAPGQSNLSMADWADKIGYKGLSKEDFTRTFQTALDDHALDYFTMVKQALRAEKSGKPVIDTNTYVALVGMWHKESSAANSPATMTMSAFNNSLLRFMLPLNGWAIRRALDVARLRLDEKGQAASMAGVAKSMLGLAALAAGGLGVSAMVDAYNEELLRKKRNLRRLTLDQSPGNLAYAVLEHSARVGTFGMLGDIANALVNVGTGQGDNRGISFDGRVMFMNSALGMTRAASAFINQDFNADYAGVIRPALFSLGGNGALQYMQLANATFGLDNEESRAVARTNVGNWLRVVGRELGMEVRTSVSSGGFNTPTPMTPYITRMQLAALGDSMEDFMGAYRDALAQAREDGSEDPAKSVERSFASRNPLRSIFRTSLTEQQYRQILNAMPDDGRQDVMEAVNLFNRYGARIGVTPFDGKQERVKAAPSPFKSPFDRESRLQQGRLAAMSF